MKGAQFLTGIVYALLLSACGGGQDASTDNKPASQTAAADNSATSEESATNTSPTRPEQQRPLPNSEAAMAAASCDSGTNLEGGRHYRVEMPSRVDGAAIVFEVFEPNIMDCRNKHPLILEGHGFSGSRQTSAGSGFMGPIAQLVAANYTVISIDQRGHGESGGGIRVMDPDYAGRDLVQIVDWAEQHLDYLAYRQNNLLLGAVGGSYGGGYQNALYQFDPDQRLDAMVPQITWNDLTYSLSPGGAMKGYWGTFLSVMGDSQTGFAMDPLVRSMLAEAAGTNRLPEEAKDFLYYHSPDYSCANDRDLRVLDAGNTDDYTFDPALQLLPVTADGHYLVQQPPVEPYPVDVLMFQGIRDTLFGFNEAYRNYQCMSRAGGDVRLLTYPWGHHFLEPDPSLLQDSVNNAETLAENFQSIYDRQPSVISSCGDIEAAHATLAWFDEKLRGRGDADNVITSGDNICMSLGYGDAVNVDHVTIGGTAFPIRTLPGLPVITQSGLSGAVPTPVPLTRLQQDAVLAGIPTVELDLSLLDGSLESLCQEETDPVAGLGTCDVILYAGLGVISPERAGPELIDGQVHPLRGLGHHSVELEGVAERLQAGDELVMLLYGVHPTFSGTQSRDELNAAVQVSGRIAAPLLSADGQAPLGQTTL